MPGPCRQPDQRDEHQSQSTQNAQPDLADDDPESIWRADIPQSHPVEDVDGGIDPPLQGYVDHEGMEEFRDFRYVELVPSEQIMQRPFDLSGLESTPPRCWPVLLFGLLHQ